MSKVDKLLKSIRKCTICESHLPNGVRPVLQLNSSAKILIAGQAPGRKVHDSGIPFDDASGDRLRAWMGVSKEVFYDENKIAILPMAFCYPGKGKSGDLPPRKECEEVWRKQVMEQLVQVEMTLVLGKYAQVYHIGSNGQSLTEFVKSWQGYWPSLVPLPHPSPRNNIWLSKNAWFKADVIPRLQERVSVLLE